MMVDSISFSAIAGFADELHVVPAPDAHELFLEQENVIARQRVRRPRSKAAIQGGITPHKLGHGFFDYERPELIVVGLHEDGLVRALVHRNVVIHGDDNPALGLAVVKSHPILSSKTLLTIQNHLLHRTRILGETRQRGDEPTVTELSLHAISRFDVALIQHHRLVLRSLAQLRHAHPIAPTMLRIRTQRRVTAPLFIFKPYATDQTAAHRGEALRQQQTRVRAHARPQVGIHRVEHQHER